MKRRGGSPLPAIDSLKVETGIQINLYETRHRAMREKDEGGRSGNHWTALIMTARTV